MKNSNAIKDAALGMPHGTAGHQLRKGLLFKFAAQLGLTVCFNCGKIIESVDDLSIEHKLPWLNADNPREAFFDLDNIAFSHLRCNVPHDPYWKKIKKIGPDGTSWCSSCQEFLSVENFTKDMQRHDGLCNKCKKCTSRARLKDKPILS